MSESILQQVISLHTGMRRRSLIGSDASPHEWTAVDQKEDKGAAREVEKFTMSTRITRCAYLRG